MAVPWSKLSRQPVRKIGRFLAVLAIAIAAGHLAQTLAARKAAPTAVAASMPIKIVELSASPQESGLMPKAHDAAKALPEKHIFLPAPTLPATKPLQARDCTLSLTAATEPGAVVALTLRAPCDGGARVVLAHGGLTVTARVADGGGLSLAVPALDQTGRFEIRFADGRSVAAVHPVPDLVGVKRFVVQWLGLDGFVLHGFENGADFGQPGDVSPSQPGPDATGGSLVVLGELGVDSPLMAQIYTFPAQGSADIVVEAPVTAANCAQEMLGQTISSLNGAAQVVDLTLAMPDCSAVGDFLVLKNLASDMKLATR